MTDERKTDKAKNIPNLELNKETVQDLAEEEAEKVAGGQIPNCSVVARGITTSNFPTRC